MSQWELRQARERSSGCMWTADNGRPGNRGKRGKAFEDLCTSDEAAMAQDEGGGVEWLLHANRGQASWNKTASEKIKQVFQFARDRYSGLNDTYLTEKLKEKDIAL
jgi:hypothetical protein